MRCATGVSVAGSASGEIFNEEFFESSLSKHATLLVIRVLLTDLNPSTALKAGSAKRLNGLKTV
jgi:hypothetical protein